MYGVRRMARSMCDGYDTLRELFVVLVFFWSVRVAFHLCNCPELVHSTLPSVFRSVLDRKGPGLLRTFNRRIPSTAERLTHTSGSAGAPL